MRILNEGLKCSLDVLEDTGTLLVWATQGERITVLELNREQAKALGPSIAYWGQTGILKES